MQILWRRVRVRAAGMHRAGRPLLLDPTLDDDFQPAVTEMARAWAINVRRDGAFQIVIENTDGAHHRDSPDAINSIWCCWRASSRPIARKTQGLPACLWTDDHHRPHRDRRLRPDAEVRSRPAASAVSRLQLEVHRRIPAGREIEEASRGGARERRQGCACTGLANVLRGDAEHPQSRVQSDQGRVE